MKALVYMGKETVRLQDIPEPKQGEEEVLIKVIAAGICGTDIGAVKGRPPIVPPITIGHEFVGRRVDTGELVVVNPCVSCCHCTQCLHGRMHLCQNRKVIGFHRPGAFAERIAVPRTNVVPVSGVSMKQAALADVVGTALHAFRLAGPSLTGPVAVLGAGAIGLSVLFVLKKFGIDHITVTDVVPERLEYARLGGADKLEARPTGQYEAVFDTVGMEATRQDAVATVRPGGTAVMIGLHDVQLSVPGGVVVAGEKKIQGSFGYTEGEFLEAARLVADIDTRWTASIPFSQAEETFSSILQGRGDPAQVKVQFLISDE
jgi:2-desacetyl-2-hydroxyethyl bacteriochlorophyllide A dehydrogenase